MTGPPTGSSVGDRRTRDDRASDDGVSYVPGEGTMLVGRAGIILLGPDASETLVRAVRASIVDDGDGSVPRILEAIASEGFTALDSLACLLREPAGTRLVVRGEASATGWDGNGEPHSLYSPHNVTWSDELVPSLAGVELQLHHAPGARGEPDGPDEIDSRYFVIDGIAPARACAWGPVAELERSRLARVADLDADDDGMEGSTITLTAVRSTAPPSPDSGSTAGTIDAVLCNARHPNRPGASTCRLCTAPVPADQPVISVPQPTLGVLVGSDGRVIPLDRRTLLGRRPVRWHDAACSEERADDEPRLEALPDPEKVLSRTHAEIVARGWDVFVTDLGSTNKTYLLLADQQLHELVPHQPAGVEPSTQVVLADTFALRYDVTDLTDWPGAP